MKQITYIFFGVLALLFTSCEKEHQSEVASPNFEDISYSLSVDDVGITRSSGTTSYVMQVFDAEGTSAVNCFSDFATNRSTNTTGKFTVTLDKSKVHTILFWAEDNADVYNTEDLRAVTLVPGKEMSDAFFGSKIEKPTSSTTNITLNHAVSNVVLKETETSTSLAITVSYNRFTTFNVSKGGAESAIETVTEMTVGNKTEIQLGSFLTFAPADKAQKTSFTFIAGSDSKLISDVTLITNRPTNLTGHFFDPPIDLQFKLDNADVTKRANSYVIPLTADITHKLSIERIDDYWTSIDALCGGNTPANTIAQNADMKIKVVWADFKYDGVVTPTVNATEKSMLVKVGTLPAKGGNMVVAVTNADGSVILWSWHLWFSDIAVTPETCVASTATALLKGQSIMDRNLGAKSFDGADVETYGLMYQWGRKDPFTGYASVDGSVESTVYTPTNLGGRLVGAEDKATNGTIALAIQNPFTFYTNTRDWVMSGIDASATDSKRWNNSTDGLTEGTKTIFDPCPRGWRMPWGGDWSGFTKENFPWQTTPTLGRKYGDSANAFFPAAGRLSYSTGAIEYGGTSGYVWSSAVSTTKALFLLFYASVVFPANSYGRASGMSVRCVQE